jgi:hypothetical protein
MVHGLLRCCAAKERAGLRGKIQCLKKYLQTPGGMSPGVTVIAGRSFHIGVRVRDVCRILFERIPRGMQRGARKREKTGPSGPKARGAESAHGDRKRRVKRAEKPL